jgi:uncharacterized protein DUF4384
MRASTLLTALAMVGAVASTAAAQDAALRDLNVEQSNVAQAGTSRPGSLRMTTWFDRSDLTYAQGESVRIFVQTSEDAYVTVFNVGPSGQAIQLFPNAFQTSNLVRANVPVEIPSANARIAVNGPFGAELVKIVASDKPLTIVAESQLDHRGGVFRLLAGGASALQRNLEVTSAAPQDQRIAVVNRGIRTVASRSAAMTQTVPVTAAVAAPAAAPPAGPAASGSIAGLAALSSKNPFPLLIATDKPAYRVGERVTLAVTTLQPCFLTVLDVNAAGQARVIFPNQHSRNNQLAAAQTVLVSGGGAAPAIEARAPVGAGAVVAVCSTGAAPVLSAKAPDGGMVFADAGTIDVVNRDLAVVASRPAGTTAIAVVPLAIEP